MKLANIMLARGALCRSSSGMMGRSTQLSTQRQAGKHTADMASEATVNGWLPGWNCQPVLASSGEVSNKVCVC